MKPEKIKGKRVLVVGMARSGVAAARLLARAGATVKGTDLRSTPEILRHRSELDALDVSLHLGTHPLELLDDIDLTVVSPGVPPKTPILQEAQRRGIAVVDEVEVASWFVTAPIVAVTGSNGKSTTVAWLGEIFRQSGVEVIVAGNIGRPLSGQVSEVSDGGVVVVEVSSFQLERATTFHPFVAVLLNLTPDHIDRHRSFRAYQRAKERIFLNQSSEDYAVLNADDRRVFGLSSSLQGQVIPFSLRRELDGGAFVRDGHLITRWSGRETKVAHRDEISLPGPHNLANALAVTAAVLPFSLSRKGLRRGLTGFEGLKHRLEPIGTIDGVTFINDSKATNLESMRYALLSVTHPIVLIAGGRDKGSNFAPLKDLVGQRVKVAILLGEARDKMARSWGRKISWRSAENMEEAVMVARAAAEPGDCVLLSPGCASFDMFRNFEDRGDQFRVAVEKMAEKSHRSAQNGKKGSQAIRAKWGGTKRTSAQLE